MILCISKCINSYFYPEKMPTLPKNYMPVTRNTPILLFGLSVWIFLLQGPLRLEKYLNIQDCLEKYLKNSQRALDFTILQEYSTLSLET